MFIHKLMLSGGYLSMSKIINLAYDRISPQLFELILYKSILDDDIINKYGRGLLNTIYSDYSFYGNKE